jgi:signal transduction histidine kinase
MSSQSNPSGIHELLRQLEHDLRNPLGTVIMSAQALLRTPLSADQEKITRVVLRSSEKALSVVTDLLQAQIDNKSDA